MIRRTLTTALHSAAHDGPVLLEGPRGAGKSTLLANEFPRWAFVSLEEPRDRRAARSNPAAFLARLRKDAVIDEAQRAPELVRHLRGGVLPPSLIVASSRKLRLPMTTLRLYWPTRAEREGRIPLPAGMLGHFVPAAAGSARSAAPWRPHQRLVEGEVGDMLQVRDPDRFERFLEVARSCSGQVLNEQRIARMAGVSHTTVVRWLSALDDCLLTVLLPPFELSFGRRLVRSPKLHFLDSPLLESVVVSEIYRNAAHTGVEPSLRYWRDSNGLELPLVLQAPGAPPAAVAIAETPNPIDEARLRRFMGLAGLRSAAMVSRHATRQQRGPILRYTLEQL
jgi:hypothetical protein